MDESGMSARPDNEAPRAQTSSSQPIGLRGREARMSIAAAAVINGISTKTGSPSNRSNPPWRSVMKM